MPKGKGYGSRNVKSSGKGGGKHVPQVKRGSVKLKGAKSK